MRHHLTALIGTVVLTITITLTGGNILGEGVDPLQGSIADKVLRFHVLANSDSEADQELKLKVRDAVGEYLRPRLADASNIRESSRIVDDNLQGVIRVAQETLAENGCHDVVKAQLEVTDFPEKSYGDYTFPKGEYQALRVVIGEGRGHNWWCVLYPNMCFRGSFYEEIDSEAGEELREVLSPAEYEDVAESGDFKIRLKFLEWFQ